MKYIKKYLFIVLALCACAYLGTNFALFSQDDRDDFSIPPHLQAGRALLDGVLPENNSYRNRPSVVSFKGEQGATQYICHTDCSGLVDALFAHTYGYTPQDFQKWTGKKRAKASSYYRTISNNYGFTNITNINDVLPGDLISFKLPPGSKNFGHVMLVDEKPKALQSSPPLIPDTTQWDVTIIDCTGHGHGLQDTRYLGNGKYHSGIGRGELRLYTNSAGLVVGFAWSTQPKAKFYDQVTRPIVIGRLIPGFRP
jgi:hypothetical protein